MSSPQARRSPVFFKKKPQGTSAKFQSGEIIKALYPKSQCKQLEVNNTDVDKQWLEKLI